MDEQELAQMEEAYQRYATLKAAYLEVLRLEDDPYRKQAVEAALASLDEDNK